MIKISFFLTQEIKVTADAGAGAFAVSTDIVSEKTINGVQQPKGSISEPKAKAGASASVGVEYSIKGESSVIKDTVDQIKEVLE